MNPLFTNTLNHKAIAGTLAMTGLTAVFGGQRWKSLRDGFFWGAVSAGSLNILWSGVLLSDETPNPDTSHPAVVLAYHIRAPLLFAYYLAGLYYGVTKKGALE